MKKLKGYWRHLILVGVFIPLIALVFTSGWDSSGYTSWNKNLFRNLEVSMELSEATPICRYKAIEEGVVDSDGRFLRSMDAAKEFMRKNSDVCGYMLVIEYRWFIFVGLILIFVGAVIRLNLTVIQE